MTFTIREFCGTQSLTIDELCIIYLRAIFFARIGGHRIFVKGNLLLMDVIDSCIVKECRSL